MVSKKGCPDGLQSAAEIISKIPNGVLSELCMNVLLFIQYKKSQVDTSRIHQLLQASEIQFSLDSVQQVANALCYYYRNAVTDSLSVETFADSLKAAMLYSEEKIQVITKAWQLEGKFMLENELKEHLSIGELLGIDWKLSMAVSSSACKNVNAPTITMLIQILNPDGEVTKKVFEMTHSQFNKFSTQLEQTKSVLETV